MLLRALGAPGALRLLGARLGLRLLAFLRMLLGALGSLRALRAPRARLGLRLRLRLALLLALFLAVVTADGLAHLLVADILVVLVDAVNLLLDVVRNIGDNDVVVADLFLDPLLAGLDGVAVLHLNLDLLALAGTLLAGTLGLLLDLVAGDVALGTPGVLRARLGRLGARLGLGARPRAGIGARR